MHMTFAGKYVICGMCVSSTCGGQKRATDPLEVELGWLGVMWVLGIELQLSLYNEPYLQPLKL